MLNFRERYAGATLQKHVALARIFASIRKILWIGLCESCSLFIVYYEAMLNHAYTHSTPGDNGFMPTVTAPATAKVKYSSRTPNQ